MTQVVFATPSTTHSVCLDFHNSMLRTERLCLSLAMETAHLSIGGDCYLWKVRSHLASKFLADFPNATDLFFLDDDIGWPEAKVIDFLNRPEPVVGGVYPKKSDQLDFPLELVADGQGKPISRDGLLQAASLGAGFLRIKRHVLEEMAAGALPFRETRPGGEVWDAKAFFLEGVGPDGHAWGEDKYFFNKWIEMGGEVWIDPDIQFSHQGHKKWRANLADYAANMKISAPEREQAA
jgi:hypothetical protein